MKQLSDFVIESYRLLDGYGDEEMHCQIVMDFLAKMKREEIPHWQHGILLLNYIKRKTGRMVD